MLCLVAISLMKGAEELCVRKPVRPEYGGGNKEFVFEDQHFFVNSDDPATFFSSQERQSVVRHMLLSLRAHQGDAMDKIQFLEGQAVGMKVRFVLILTIPIAQLMICYLHNPAVACCSVVCLAVSKR